MMHDGTAAAAAPTRCLHRPTEMSSRRPCFSRPVPDTTIC